MTTALRRQLSPLRPGAGARDLGLLRSLERRVLWLSAKQVDHANHTRPNTSGVKVGGHQASSASMATLMTALWFDTLTAADRVSVADAALGLVGRHPTRETTA
jgi:pyruvate dehydrogenase E1 component